MNKRERAKQILTWYVRILMDKSGLRYDADNEGELDELVDCLIDAAKEELTQTMQQAAAEMIRAENAESEYSPHRLLTGFSLK